MKAIKRFRASILFMLGCYLSVGNSYSQDMFHVVKLSPQHFFASTMKIDFEIFKDRRSYIISPSLTVIDRDDEKVLGAGIELGRRFYVSNKEIENPQGFYGNIHLIYNYYNTDYTTSFYTYNYNYYYPPQYYSESFHERIHQGGLDFSLGYQVSFGDLFFLDMFFGGGMRMGISSRGKDSFYKFSIIDYAYNGVIPKSGIRLGLRF
jgi:hypothetical protein